MKAKLYITDHKFNSMTRFSENMLKHPERFELLTVCQQYADVSDYLLGDKIYVAITEYYNINENTMYILVREYPIR